MPDVAITPDPTYLRTRPSDPLRRFRLTAESYGWVVEIFRHRIQETGTTIYRARLNGNELEIYGMTLHEVLNETADLLRERVSEWESEAGSELPWSIVRSRLASRDGERIEGQMAARKEARWSALFRRFKRCRT